MGKIRKRVYSIYSKESVVFRTLLLLLIPYLLLSVYVQYKHISDFGCFDDCSTFMAAFFMLKGKHLYSEIFANHQMLAIYISYLIQRFFHPQTMYKLLVYHRLVIIGFSLIMDALLLFRFRKKALGFIFFYEFLKIYLFGNRFLAEAFIVYPLVYMFGLIWEGIEKRYAKTWEYLLSGVCAWFVIFMREPYIPLALFFYTILLWQAKAFKTRILSLCFFIFLTVLTLGTVSFPDYYFNVITVNKMANPEIAGGGLIQEIIKGFFYPVLLLFGGIWNNFRIFLVICDIIFLILFGCILKEKKYHIAGFIFFSLGLSNMRFVVPGRTYYEAFHILQWYALFITALFFLFNAYYKRYKNSGYVFLGILVLALLGGIFFPGTILYEKVDKQANFVTNYGKYIAYGDAIKRIASSADTLFVDRWDDMIYWEANLPSAYKYSWYTSVMPVFPLYRKAREDMLRFNPPAFFYGFCPPHTKVQVLPNYRKNDYERLYFAENATCLYINKSKIAMTPEAKWKELKKYQFHLFGK